jgi:flagellar FliL protein
MAAPVRPQKAPAPAKQAAPREAAPPPPPPKEPKVKRGPLLPAIVIAVALLGAAFMLKGGGDGGGGGASVAATTETTAVDSGDPSHVVALDAITLNLADGRFLKLGLALQLADGTEVTDGAAFGARALDESIDLLGSYTYRELNVPGAREEAKTALSEAVSAAYDGVVLEVYFTEFVMQ